ncbi:SIR2 family protein [Priestia aryabhattai]|uniref:SIR2 family protein n=1 Tax=Priestia aryabhattai TaxID=412384 RepID=UPI003CEAE2A7
MNQVDLQELRSAYKSGKLIPFIGAGLSYPFGIPDWDGLINEIKELYVTDGLKEAINFSLRQHDYWKAVDDILHFGTISEFQLQQAVVNSIKSKPKNIIDAKEHNYNDLASLGFSNLITTNYDFLLSEHIKGSIPQILHNVENNVQEIFDKTENPNIWHIHGHINSTGSIILSRNKYNELYENGKYKDLFKVLQGNGIFLFLGFSFNDQYIQKLLSDNNQHLNSQHYILLSNPTPEMKLKFANDYGINVIDYNPTNSTHANEIREILRKISSDGKVHDSESNEGNNPKNSNSDTPMGLQIPSKEDKSKMENGLFCKKIRLEPIDEDTLDYTKDCFFMSDSFIRSLRNKGFSEEIIKHILSVCYMAYKKIKTSIYKNTKNSQLFIDEVHRSLSTIGYPQLKEILTESISPMEFQNVGFIHILADDVKEDIWWGENRIDR